MLNDQIFSGMIEEVAEKLTQMGYREKKSMLDEEP